MLKKSSLENEADLTMRHKKQIMTTSKDTELD